MKTAAGIVGICLAVLGLGAMISLFVDYRSSETTDDAQIEQYLSPVNIRVPGYIKRICFTEHQHVRKGDTLLVLEDDEYRIRLKQAEAALMEARSGRKVVAHTLNTVANTASVYDASIVEAQYRADQLEKDYHRYSALLKKKATTPIVVEQYQTQWEMARARVGECSCGCPCCGGSRRLNWASSAIVTRGTASASFCCWCWSIAAHCLSRPI